MRALSLLALLGCTRHEDPCAGIAGPCVGVHLDSEVLPIDQIRITLDGGLNRLTPAAPAALAFPLRFAVTLPETATRAHLDFSGLKSPREVATASAEVTLGAGGHADLSVTLRAPGAPDLAGADFAGADFTEVDLAGADLTPLPDLAAQDLAGADLTPLPDLLPPRDLAVVYPITVSVGGTGTGTVAVDGANCLSPPCTFNKLPGAMVTVAAVATGGSTLVATTGACTSNSTTCTFPINGPAATKSNFKSPTQVALTVLPYPISVSNATLAVSPAPSPASCGANCYLYAKGTVVTLTASVTGGQFLGWGGAAGCRGLACDVTVDDDTGVTASFSDGVPNYVFTSSTTYTTTQLNQAGTPQATADGYCQTLAMGAGLTDYASFKAWLSVAGTSAPSRLSGARGWVRMDGLPFADDIASTVTAGSPYHPLLLDQNAALPNPNVWTGTFADGSVGANCTNWTDNTSGGGGLVGLVSDGGPAWTANVQGGCSIGAALYCFGTARNFPLTFAAPAGARRAFVTNAVQDGAQDGDAQCQMEAALVGVGGRFRAWRNRSTAKGLIVFDQTLGPWVRADHVLLAPIASRTLLDGTTAQQLAPLHQTAAAAYQTSSSVVWIGDAVNTCGDWTNAGLNGGYYLASRIRAAPAIQACGSPSHWYCFQE